ncbi:hypothetical protein BH23ACT4_BH23ACT4_06410 [soil metagenome]
MNETEIADLVPLSLIALEIGQPLIGWWCSGGLGQR